MRGAACRENRVGQPRRYGAGTRVLAVVSAGATSSADVVGKSVQQDHGNARDRRDP
jgi:hypothetical protein